jgi:hypothetical protein
VVGTLAGSGMVSLNHAHSHFSFDTVIVDESAQARRNRVATASQPRRNAPRRDCDGAAPAPPGCSEQRRAFPLADGVPSGTCSVLSLALRLGPTD